MAMNNKLFFTIALFAVTLFSSCELVGDIFQAGFYTAIFVVIAIVAVVIWILNRFRGRR
jgi:hypothetical protein